MPFQLPSGGTPVGVTPPTSTPWPLAISEQASAIASACNAYHVPTQVFMGMYHEETGLGTNVTNSTAGAIGPFQFEPSTASSYGYPLTNTPNLGEFQSQAYGAAHYLSDLYNQLHSWHSALAAYNAGPGNISAGNSYADAALAFVVPADWAAALGNPVPLPGGTAGLGGTGTLPNDSGNANFTVGNPSNPDEDYWTAINRLAMERYWYFFPMDLMTPVPVPQGWTTIGELKVGDKVFGTNGAPAKVVGLSPIYADRQCYRVTFKDGSSIVTDADHAWETAAYCRDGALREHLERNRWVGTRTTQEIAGSIFVRHHRKYNHQIPLPKPLKLPNLNLPIDPYIFGVWLGDGSKTNPKIYTGIKDRAHWIAEIQRARLVVTNDQRDEDGSVLHLSTGKRGELPALLRALNVYDNKHIPVSYLRSSEAQRLALLQGLMDSDGAVGNRRCLFANVNERLADDVRELLRTLGLRAYRRVVKGGRTITMPRGHTSTARDLITIAFPATPDLVPFRLQRKREAYQAILTGLRGVQHRRCHVITGVEPVDSVPVRCITVDTPDHLFLAGDGMVPTHNSDGETVYLSDGPDLMRQTPALTPDRVTDADRINHLDLLYDNTAWQYTATHRKRRRTQRRTSLAKITSPVEGNLNWICDIDDVRAGDAAVLANCGPGDGTWLVGDCRRSMFSIYSEITLALALTPLTEGQLNPIAGVNKSNLGSVPTGDIQGYITPVGPWQPSRIDQGVDGTLTTNPVAPGNSHILVANASDAGWQGGGYIAGQLLDGRLAGKVWYIAEGITPIVATGQDVNAGTVIAHLRPNPYNTITGNIEIGWADPNSPGRPLAQSLPGYGGDQSPQGLAAGNSFNRFLVALGSPGGTVQGAGAGVNPAPLPGGYP